jgi:arylsulfatase A-like enzyme
MQGCRFTDAHSASAVCSPSRYALLTGQYPFRKDLYGAIFCRESLAVDTALLTIGDIMKKAGYATACIGKWHLGFGVGDPDWNKPLKPGPLELGFDYFFGIPTVSSHPPFVYVENHQVVGYNPEDPFVWGERAETQEFSEKFNINQIGGAKTAHAIYKDQMVGTTLTEKAVNWIRDHKEGPFFLYFATTNIHHPFTPNPRFNGTSECGRYGDFIHELDWIVGKVMKTLDDLKLADRTLVIFTSDNGGMLNQGGQNAWLMGHRQNGYLLGFKFDAWEGGHRIPFIARWPGKIKPGSVSDQLICNVDIMGGLAALTGYKLKAGEGPDSYNLLPALSGDTKCTIRDHAVLAANHASHLSLRMGDWIYIPAQGGGGFQGTMFGNHGLGGPAALWFAGEQNSDVENGKIKPDAPKEQLYNMKTDLSQTRNVIAENPDVAEKMKKLLNDIKQKEQTRP